MILDVLRVGGISKQVNKLTNRIKGKFVKFLKLLAILTST